MNGIISSRCSPFIVIMRKWQTSCPQKSNSIQWKKKTRSALYGHLCNIHFRSHCTLVRASKTSYTLCYVKFMLRISLSAKANLVCRMSYAKTNDSAVAIDFASQPTTHTIHTYNAAVFILYAVAAIVVKVCFVQFSSVLTCSIELHKPSASELKQTHI